MNISVTFTLPDFLLGLRRSPPATPPRQPPVPLDQSCPDATADLVQRVDMALGGRDGRILQFLSARPGEGTSSIAAAYARAAAETMKRRVLLVDASPAAEGCDGKEGGRAAPPGLVDAALAGRPLSDAVHPLTPLLGMARLVGDAGVAANMRSLITRPDFWAGLRAGFAETVVDSPAVATARLGLVTAPHADGVVVVVEAERTRAPVARKLAEDLAALGAPVLGTVLNRRRFYLPQSLYERL